MSFFFFNDTATTEIYTLSLHDALPIWLRRSTPGHARRSAGERRPRPLMRRCDRRRQVLRRPVEPGQYASEPYRSEEHTSELQSRQYLVCRLLLEKKNKIPNDTTTSKIT